MLAAILSSLMMLKKRPEMFVFFVYYVGNSASVYFAVFLGRKIKKIKRRKKKVCTIR